MADGVSVLAALQAAVPPGPVTKPAKGTLTVLPSEQNGPSVLPKTTAPFPNDMPAEVIGEKVRELDRIIAHLTESRDALAALIEAPPAEAAQAPTAKDLQKAAERDADAAALKRERMAALAAEPEDLGERMARLKAEAQAAVFTPDVPQTPDVPLEAEQPADVEQCEHGWSCPEHGGWVGKVSERRGRAYHGCPTEGCREFERL